MIGLFFIGFLDCLTAVQAWAMVLFFNLHSDYFWASIGSDNEQYIVFNVTYYRW